MANIAAPPMPWKARERVSSEHGLARSPQAAEPSGEQPQADHEDPTPTVEVGQGAGREQQRGQAEGVGVDDPLQVRDRGVELALDVGQRDVDDRDVEQQHEDARRDRHQGPPLRVALARRLQVATAVTRRRGGVVAVGGRGGVVRSRMAGTILRPMGYRQVLNDQPSADVRSLMLPELAQHTGHLLWRARMRGGRRLAETLRRGVDVHAFAVPARPRRRRAALPAGPRRGHRGQRTTVGTVAARPGRAGPRRAGAQPRRPSFLAAHPHPRGRRRRTPVGRPPRRHHRRVDRRAVRPRARRAHRPPRSRHDPLLAATVPAELRSSVGFLIVRLHEHQHRELVDALAPIGLEPRHLGSLVALFATGPVAQTDLARHLAISPARVVQLVDDLEARGLLERRAAPGDRRTHLLHVTADASHALTALHRRRGRRARPGARRARDLGARTPAAAAGEAGRGPDLSAPLGWLRSARG